MADDMQQLEDWAGTLLRRLEPARRREVARTLARDLRRSQRDRIAAQRNPDGSAFAPRKPRKDLRSKAGRIKRRAMFAKLRTAKFMKARGTPDAAVVEFTGRVARIARVHQHGLVDRVEPGGPEVRYARRQLLGFTSADRIMVRDRLIDMLSGI